MTIREGIYRHYKGNLYRVLFAAKHTESLEELVIYEDATDAGKRWARPERMFGETVWVNGEEVPRFRYLARSLEELGADGEAL